MIKAVINNNVIIKLYQQGLGINELSKKFKCHTRRIKKILDDNNIPRHYGGSFAVWTESRKEKVSKKLKGRKKSSEFCENNSRIHKGKKLSEKTKEKIRLSRIGKFCKEENPNWRGGVTTENELIRKSNKYKEWRLSVFERDNYTCQFCGEVGGELHADHIKPFSTHKNLRFNINNGRILCASCHRDTPTYGAKAIQKQGVMV